MVGGKVLKALGMSIIFWTWIVFGIVFLFKIF